MATAYLLASVLTLIVVLVHGQEAFPEQGNIVVVAEDSFEDELNSFTDLILPGSANTRAECIQKKKCKNKGGTCQNKGNTCPGKFVKGCSKGCSCCLPEEISCKPSKRCKRANGACIARGECNGKIISTGCKKPRSCKKTHICCVQDERTTEAPTCRAGPSGCLIPDECPNDKFRKNHICKNCKKNNVKSAQKFMKKLDPQPSNIGAYLVFSNGDISYSRSDDNTLCNIKNPGVKTFTCEHVNGQWECELKGFCTAASYISNGVYVDGSFKCHCPNINFDINHVCECKTEKQTMAQAKQLDIPENTPYLLFNKNDYHGNKISYSENHGVCLIKNPVKTWTCENVVGVITCTNNGLCTAESEFSNGVYKPSSKNCEYCPNINFAEERLCVDCKDTEEASDSVNALNLGKDILSYFVFWNNDYNNNLISFSFSDDKTLCHIKYAVKTWTCTRVTGKKWSCELKGFCTAASKLSNGAYVDGSMKCKCPKGKIYEKYICEGCKHKDQALTFVKNLNLDPRNIPFHPVFGNKDNDGNMIDFVPSDDEKMCTIKNPVETWKCQRVEGEWTCALKGFCTSKIELDNGGTINPNSIECKCPNGNFNDKHVCKGCKTFKNALKFVKEFKTEDSVMPLYPVLSNKDFDENIITFTLIENPIDNNQVCLVDNPVMTWFCEQVNGEWTKCQLEGFCTSNSELVDGSYRSVSLKCECPNPNFEKKHVCDTCITGKSALEYTEKREDTAGPNTVFDGRKKILYEKTERNNEFFCQITRPVQAWDVMKNTDGEWYIWQDLGQCINIDSALNSGHFFFEDKKCYKDHTSKRWSDDQCSPLVILEARNYESCMEDCKTRLGCTAFDYRIGIECTMRNCPIPAPEPDTYNIKYNGYYLNTGYKQTSKIWGDDQCDTVGAVFESTYSGECMKECKSRPGCTAINYEVGKECTMKNCPVPVPPPNKDNPGFVGYYLFDIGPSTVI